MDSDKLVTDMSNKEDLSLLNKQADGSIIHCLIKQKNNRLLDILLRNYCPEILNVKSEGLDALHTAVRQGDALIIYQLLQYGADVNSLDNEQLSPLLWLIKYTNSRKSKRLMQLLLRFGASVALKTPTADTALHIMAEIPGFDMEMAFSIYQAGLRCNLHLMTNDRELNPYTVARLCENRQFTKFLMDAILYNLPFGNLIPLAMSMVLLLLAYMLISWRLVWGAVITFFIVNMCGNSLFLSTIITSYQLVLLGYGIGLLLLILYSYFSVIRHYTSDSGAFLFYILAACTIATSYSACTLKPTSAPSSNRIDMLALVASYNDMYSSSESNSDLHDVETPLVSRKIKLCTACLVDRGQSNAVHCPICNMCVVDYDKHCPYTGMCVGRANMRGFVFFLLSLFLFFFVYFFQSYHAISTAYCPDSTGILWGYLAVHYCLLFKYPGISLLNISAAYYVIYVGVVMFMQSQCIVNETTMYFAKRRMYYVEGRKEMTFKRAVTNWLEFLQTGKHKVSIPPELADVDNDDLLLDLEILDRANTHDHDHHHHHGKCCHHDEVKGVSVDATPNTELIDRM
jgi:hypothetical protein